MPTPVTRFDGQYSDPAATATGWAETCAVLDAAELFWLSAVRSDGRPHVTPAVAAWAQGAAWSSTGAVEQKCANLRANPHVVPTTGGNSRDRGPDVKVDGAAVQDTDDSVLERIAAVSSRSPTASADPCPTTRPAALLAEAPRRRNP